MLISPGKPTRNILPSSSETKNFSFYSFICEGTHFGQWIRPKLKQSYLLNLIILLLHYMTVFMVSQWTSTASWIHFYNLTLQTTIVDGIWSFMVQNQYYWSLPLDVHPWWLVDLMDHSYHYLLNSVRLSRKVTKNVNLQNIQYDQLHWTIETSEKDKLWKIEVIPSILFVQSSSAITTNKSFRLFIHQEGAIN